MLKVWNNIFTDTYMVYNSITQQKCIRICEQFLDEGLYSSPNRKDLQLPTICLYYHFIQFNFYEILVKKFNLRLFVFLTGQVTLIFKRKLNYEKNVNTVPKYLYVPKFQTNNH